MSERICSLGCVHLNHGAKLLMLVVIDPVEPLRLILAIVHFQFSCKKYTNTSGGLRSFSANVRCVRPLASQLCDPQYVRGCKHAHACTDRAFTCRDISSYMDMRSSSISCMRLSQYVYVMCTNINTRRMPKESTCVMYVYTCRHVFQQGHKSALRLRVVQPAACMHPCTFT